MLHYLTLGHLDLTQVKNGKTLPLKPLDMAVVRRLLAQYGETDAQGHTTLGGYPVEVQASYLVCPWLMPHTIHATENFARQLHQETGCVMADVGKRLVLGLEAFEPAAVAK